MLLALLRWGLFLFSAAQGLARTLDSVMDNDADVKERAPELGSARLARALFG